MGCTRIQLGTSAKIAVVIATLGAAVNLQATVLNTTNPADIAAFQSGATVQTFDNISGITAVPISDYNPLDITANTGAHFTKDPAQSPFFNSGNANPSDPSSQPGTPIGIVTPSGGIAGDVASGANVAGPIGVVVPPFTLLEGGSFIEVIFPTAVSKVGLFVTHGSVQMFLKDTSNQNLTTGDFSTTGSTGQFIGIDRGTADIGGVTLGFGAFTIDDFTFGTTGGGGGNGGGGNGGGNNKVPDTGSTMNLALAGAFLVLARWKMRRA